MSAFAYIYWNPSRELFFIPWIHHPVGWYGALFAFGFMVGYCMLAHIFARELLLSDAVTDGRLARRLGYGLTDKLCWCIVLGTVIGGRLGHVFFYNWPYFRHHLSEIPQVWLGGLASHGGTIGVLIALAFCYYFFARKLFTGITYMEFLDFFAAPTAFVAFCIRLGNFFNQEILGTPTRVPWAVVFGRPADGSFPTPRHPAQLYEGFFYLGLCLCLFWLWHRGVNQRRKGLLTGLFFICTFTWRFFMEFFKAPLGGFAAGPYLETGQVLSIPFIFLGFWLLLHAFRAPASVSARNGKRF